jgi:ribA/ribD-fused uncharacterized protein
MYLARKRGVVSNQDGSVVSHTLNLAQARERAGWLLEHYHPFPGTELAFMLGQTVPALCAALENAMQHEPPATALGTAWDNRFSNFAPCGVRDELGYWYPTVEHAYQASKTLDGEVRRRIGNLPKAGDAKRAGRALTLRPDWEQVKLHLMHRLLCYKYNPTIHHVFANRLVETDTQYLVETNNWHDNYWGNCICANCANIVGENWLGRLLMLRRSELAYQKGQGLW